MATRAKPRTTSSINKTIAPVVLIFLGGLVILTEAILSITGGIMGVAGIYSLVGVLCGFVTIAAAAGMYATRGRRMEIFSIVALVFAVISVVDGAGFMMGFQLVLVGGALGLVFRG